MCFIKMKRVITFIGGGNITRAMLNGVLKSNLYKPSEIIVSDKNIGKNNYVKEKWGVRVVSSNKESTLESSIVVLAVKPNATPSVFQNLKEMKEKIIVSVVAGVPLQTLKDNFHESNKVVRVMLNTPCMIQQGMSSFYSTDLNMEEEKHVQEFLQSFGKEIKVDDEKFIDIATALSGSGPIYTYLLIESMIDTGVHMGLSREKAKILVYQTILGSIQYIIETDEHPTILRNDISSPGGTTVEALHILEKERFRYTMSQAIWAAYKKSLHLKTEF